MRTANAESAGTRAGAHVAPAASSAAMHIVCPFALALSKGDLPSVERMLTSALSFTRVSIQSEWPYAAAYRTALQPSLKSNCCEVKMQEFQTRVRRWKRTQVSKLLEKDGQRHQSCHLIYKKWRNRYDVRGGRLRDYGGGAPARTSAATHSECP